ncbi:MAG: NUDIX domain-containing protein [Rhizobiaceae bacterium]|nr:NUDIX domain-containing protein [Rhizobiaceae bacterium]
MPPRSAGILAFRKRASGAEVLLVHPGGPHWRSRDKGAWSMPKGEIGPGEEPEAAARREFAEETGWTAEGPLFALGEARQRSGKIVIGFACEGDFDTETLRSNLFDMEWPPRSGKFRSFPEVDRAAWFTLEDAAEKIVSGQRPLLAKIR